MCHAASQAIHTAQTTFRNLVHNQYLVAFETAPRLHVHPSPPPKKKRFTGSGNSETILSVLLEQYSLYNGID